MASFVFNISKGRGVEFYNRVQSNDPANSALIVLALASTGVEADNVLEDKETLFDILAGTTAEPTNTGYSRKTITDADLTLIAADHVNNKMVVSIPDQTWTGVAAGDGWSDIVICYDQDTTAGTDASVIPISQHDFTKTPDGSDIIMTDPSGFLEAA